MKLIPLLVLVLISLLAPGSYSDARLQIETGFASELEAVQAAADHYNPLSIRHDREYLGAILHTDSGFAYTVVAGNRAADSVEMTIDGETWMQTVALWHTHGAFLHSRRYFSDRDTDTATRLQRPFYLTDYTGYLKVYRPGDKLMTPFVARRLGLEFRAGYAIGTYVKDRFGRPVKVRTRLDVALSS